MKNRQIGLFAPHQHRINKSIKVMNIIRMTNINVSPVVTHASLIPQKCIFVVSLQLLVQHVFNEQYFINSAYVHRETTHCLSQ